MSLAKLKARIQAKNQTASKPSMPFDVSSEKAPTAPAKDSIFEAEAKGAELKAEIFEPTEEMKEFANTSVEFDLPKFMEEMQDLERAVTEKAPDMGTLMAKIHRNLKQYPELCHILPDELIKVAVSGFLDEAKVETAPKAKGRKSVATMTKGKSKEDIDAMLDFGF